MQHPEEGTIHAWLDGALSPVESSRIESHVASCQECAARVAEARGLIAGASRIVGHLDVVPGGVVPMVKSRKRRWQAWWVSPLGLAAAAMLFFVMKGYPRLSDKLAEQRGSAAASYPVVGPAPTDSMAASGASLRAQTAERRERTITAAMDSASLPPATMALQKSAPVAQSVTAPRVAELPPLNDRRADAVAEIGTSSVAANRATSRSASAGMAAGGAGAGGVASAPMAAAAAERSAAPTMATAADTIQPFVGCYEAVGLAMKSPVTRPGQPGTIPRTIAEPPRALPPQGYASVERYDRFALMDESAPTPGQLAVRILDTAGRPDQAIYGAGWSVQGNRAVVRATNGQVVITLTRSADGTISSGGSVRVISCRK
jgi:hypothetical protein